MPPTDDELASSAKRGDQQAFEALVALHQGKTYGLALQMLRNPEDAADAAQEAFMRSYAALPNYNPGQSFGAWLYRIAYNHCLDVLRRRRGAPVLIAGQSDVDQTEEVHDPGPGVEELVERNESAETVTKALHELSDEHRHILALRYTLDLPYTEIARVLELPESTVTMRLYHAKRTLRAQLVRTTENIHGSS